MPHESFEEFKEKNPHLEQVWPYMELLRTESDRGSVLISTGFLEQQLRDILAAFMQEVAATANVLDGANAPLGTFSARINTCYSLGLISEREHHDLQLIRKIRNAFAHEMQTSFETQSVHDRCLALQMSVQDEGMPTRGKFQTAAVALIMNFINRPHYVSKQRREPQDWPY